MFGLLNLNKPTGWTSRDVVNRVAKLVGRKIKVGHAGTLDPLARGVLVVCVGPATRLVPLIHDHLKSYDGTFLLGKSSPTDDTDGPVEEVPVPATLNRDQILAALDDFRGTIQQVPPAYSAVRVDGQRAYKAARKGKLLELPSREVTVFRLELTDFQQGQFSLSIDCSTGTYIRSIGRDLARKLGTEAVMSELTRTRVGPLKLEAAVDPDQLTRETIREHLLSPVVMLDHLKKFTVSPEQMRRLGYGQSLRCPVELANCDDGEALAALDGDGGLVAIARRRSDRIAPEIVFSQKPSG